MAGNVLVHNGVLQLQDPGSAPSLLRASPPGVYTTTRTTNHLTHLLFWERHIERLSQSIKLFSKEMPQMFLQDPNKISQFDDYLKSMIHPSINKGLEKAIGLEVGDDDELTVTTFITGLTEGVPSDIRINACNGFDVYVHISRCLAVYGNIPTGRLAVMGPGRTSPNVKRSEWVRTRQVLEQAKPEDVTEIILSNDGNLLLEGMITNFYVIASRSTAMDTEKNIQVDSEKWGDAILQTAPLEGVLPGVLRRLILEICVEQGIPFQEVSPSWKERSTWLEAFTSNSVRLIQPVSSMRCPKHWDCSNDSQKWKDTQWECLTFQEAPGRLTKFIQDQVQMKSLMYSIPINTL